MSGITQLMVNFCDAVVDLQSGDTGKGKVTHSLLSSGEYDLDDLTDVEQLQVAEYLKKSAK